MDPREAVVRIVKGKLLDHLSQALPYSLNPEIEAWEVRGIRRISRLAGSLVVGSKKNQNQSRIKILPSLKF